MQSPWFVVHVIFLPVLTVTLAAYALVNRQLAAAAGRDIKAIWAYLLRRAMAEVMAKGCATPSPGGIILEPHVRLWYAPIELELRELYRRGGSPKGELELLREIERVHGAWVLSNICVPHGLYSGACLVLAAEIAREDATAGLSTTSSGKSSGKGREMWPIKARHRNPRT